MRRRSWALGIALLAAGAIGQEAKNEPKKAPVPFYRKYLVPGNALDDQILEQEGRVEESPQDANLRNDFGNVLAKRRFPEQAAEQYEIALRLDKSNFIAAYNLGLLRETEGKTQSAIAAYKKSIARKPGFPQSHFHLGRLYERDGRTEQAVGEYAKAMRIDPNMRDPKRNPLVADAELLYAASLTNYERDLAVASMRDQAVFVEESRFRKMPVDRALSSAEAAGTEESAPPPVPREIGPANAAGAAGASEAAPPAQRRAPRATAPEAPGSILGGHPRPTPGVHRPMPRPTPPPPSLAQPGIPTPAGAPSEAPPESILEPTPTPEPPMEVEPS